MKKVTFLLATLLIGGMMFTGCKKDNPSDTPETEKVYTVKYELLETAIKELTDKWSRLTMLPCPGPPLKSLSLSLSLPKLKAKLPITWQIFLTR